MKDQCEKRKIFEIEPEPGQKLDFQKVFGNDNYVHLEIGSGRGEFLLQKAQQHPEINFLALELKEKRIKTILRRLDAELHKNVKVARIFVDKNVMGIIPEKSLQKIYIIHPDPWPKKRHHRRRLIQTDFIDVLWKLLVNDGEVFISTDHEKYAGWIVNHFLARHDFCSVFKKGFSRTRPDDHIETYFEKMKREEGFPPFYMKYRKVEVSKGDK